MPTLMLQVNSPLEHERLQKMTVDQAQWGYLHAGAMLLVETGDEINKMSLDNIITTGMLLDSLYWQKTPRLNILVISNYPPSSQPVGC